MAILLQLLKLIVPLLKEYGISNLRLKRGGSKNILLIASSSTLFILTMFIAYAIEQAQTNLRLHEPMARQYQTLERNNQRLSQQLEDARTSAQACNVFMQELRERYSHAASEPTARVSRYDPEKKVMVLSEEQAIGNL